VIDREGKRRPSASISRRSAATWLRRLAAITSIASTSTARSYKVIPQIKRGERLQSRAAARPSTSTGPSGPARAVEHGGTIQNPHCSAFRSIVFQQLNAVKLSGMTNRTLDQALKVLEDAAREILPPGYSIDYTGESRQLRQEGNKFLPAFLLAVVLIFLALAVQFNSFRDPLVILAGSVAARDVRRASSSPR